jgi:hypothetical protein
MSEQTLISVSCTLPPESIPIIEEKAKAAGMSRSEFLRSLILAGIETPSLSHVAAVSLSKDPILLLHEVLFGLQRTSIGIYQLAQHSGMFTDEQLDETETKSLEAGIDYLKGLDASIARHRQQIGLEKAIG